jgi:hypothetical protein
MASGSISSHLPAPYQGVNLPQKPLSLSPADSVAPTTGISPALSDFIEFQTMMASSKNLHFKESKRVSVAKTSFLSAMIIGVVTAIPTTISAIKGQGDRVVLVPILATLAAIHGAFLGLLLNHNQD